jgi:transposase InsO family protein
VSCIVWVVSIVQRRHPPLPNYIRPRTPHLNGKVEYSHRVDDQKFYRLLDRDGIADDIHLFNDKLKEWEDYYNYHRPHGDLEARPRTNGYWQRREPERYRRPGNLQARTRENVVDSAHGYG